MDHTGSDVHKISHEYVR